jgi:hypothetical protein
MKKQKPAKKQKTSKKHAKKESWKPGDWGALAVCRYQVGGDLPAAVLLYHAKWRLRGTNGDLGKTVAIKKQVDPNSGKTIKVPVTERSGPEHKVLKRLGKEWIAASRGTWAKEAGLTLREYDRAISVLRRYGLVVARNYKLGTKVAVWIRVDWDELPKLKPDEVELYESKRDAGFRIMGGKKKFLYPKRHRMNRKVMDADAAEFMGKLAEKAAQKVALVAVVE